MAVRQLLSRVAMCRVFRARVLHVVHMHRSKQDPRSLENVNGLLRNGICERSLENIRVTYSELFANEDHIYSFDSPDICNWNILLTMVRFTFIKMFVLD